MRSVIENHRRWRGSTPRSNVTVQPGSTAATLSNMVAVPQVAEKPSSADWRVVASGLTPDSASAFSSDANRTVPSATE